MKYYEILDRVSCNFRLDINGIHGLKHWQRVWENGQRVDYREPEFRQVKDIPVTLGRKCFATGSVASKEIIDVETIDMAKYLPAGYRIADVVRTYQGGRP